MKPHRRGPAALSRPAGGLSPRLKELSLVPTFDVHLVTDCPPPRSFAVGLDELLDVLNDVQASVEAPAGLLEVRAVVETDDIVSAVRAGHGIVDRALVTLGRVGTVTAVEARSTR